jgi:hypothetical protein
MLAWLVIYRRHHRQALKPTALHLFRSPRPLLRCAFCIPAGFAGRSDVQALRRSGGSSHLFPYLPIVYRRSVTLLESTLEKVPHKAGLTTFRINTYKSVSKQRTLTTFRMNTYEKLGEGGPVILLTSSPKRIPVLSERTGMGRRCGPRKDGARPGCAFRAR